jgi:hypothetical protein
MAQKRKDTPFFPLSILIGQDSACIFYGKRRHLSSELFILVSIYMCMQQDTSSTRVSSDHDSLYDSVEDVNNSFATRYPVNHNSMFLVTTLPPC